MVSIMHEQNIICSKTLICRQLFAGHMEGARPMKKKENYIEGYSLLYIIYIGKAISIYIPGVSITFEVDD